MTARERLLAALSGDTVVPPPAAPIYLQLYLEPRRRRHLAQVYSEMAAGEIELRPTFEQEIEARLEALDRSLSVFRHPPAWLPIELAPAVPPVHGCRCGPGPHQCFSYARPDSHRLGPLRSARPGKAGLTRHPFRCPDGTPSRRPLECEGHTRPGLPLVRFGHLLGARANGR